MSHRHPHPHDGTPALAPVDGINTNMPLHARECIEHCMFSSDGPGRLMTVRQLELEGQVNKWRGGIALGIWVMGGAMAVLALLVTWSMWSFRTATRQIVIEELDKRIGTLSDHIAKRVEARFSWPFPAAEAQPLQPPIDERYRPGVPSMPSNQKRKTP